MVIKTGCCSPTDHINASKAVQFLEEYFLKTPPDSVPSTLYDEFNGLVQKIYLPERESAGNIGTSEVQQKVSDVSPIAIEPTSTSVAQDLELYVAK